MSRGERKAMITRDAPELSLSRQCRLLSIGRSSFYYAPIGVGLDMFGGLSKTIRNSAWYKKFSQLLTDAQKYRQSGYGSYLVGEGSNVRLRYSVGSFDRFRWWLKQWLTYGRANSNCCRTTVSTFILKNWRPGLPIDSSKSRETEKEQAELVGFVGVRAHAIGEQIELAVLDAVFHVAAWAIGVFVEFPGRDLVAIQGGDEEAAALFVSGLVFDLGDDAPWGRNGATIYGTVQRPVQGPCPQGKPADDRETPRPRPQTGKRRGNGACSMGAQPWTAVSCGARRLRRRWNESQRGNCIRLPALRILAHGATVDGIAKSPIGRERHDPFRASDGCLHHLSVAGSR